MQNRFKVLIGLQLTVPWYLRPLCVHSTVINLDNGTTITSKKDKRKVQGVPQSQTAALPRPQEEGETDKSKQAQTEQTYEKHYD